MDKYQPVVAFISTRNSTQRTNRVMPINDHERNTNQLVPRKQEQISSTMNNTKSLSLSNRQFRPVPQISFPSSPTAPNLTPSIQHSSTVDNANVIPKTACFKAGLILAGIFLVLICLTGLIIGIYVLVINSNTTTTAATTTTTIPTSVWSSTGSMNYARCYHTASVLADGQVLVAGGYNNVGYLLTSELYNPSTGVWTLTGGMNYPRSYHTASLLTNGKVLVTGGQNSNGYLNTAELYDPSTRVWSITGNMNYVRYYHTATVLTNGQVLVAGGSSNSSVSGALNSAELYDPSTGIWTVTGTMNYNRCLQVASILTNGTVLVAGGQNVGGSMNSAELYYPSSGMWTVTGVMNSARYSIVGCRLANGKVFVSGATTSELYNPSANIWIIAGTMNYGRYYHTVSALTNVTVLVTGGSYGSILNTAELYNPVTGIWTNLSNMASPRQYHTASVLGNGQGLVAGGFTINNGYLSSSEIYRTW